jgi:hypothetical protein
MKRVLALSVLALAAVAIAAGPASAVPLTFGVPNTFGGAAVAEDAGYFGALAGTQADLWAYPGSEVSIDTSGATPLINLFQAAPAGDINAGFPTPAAFIYETTQVKDGATISFGEEVTATIGGLFPTLLTPINFTAPGGGVDNGGAPGSTVADGQPDQLAPGALGQVSFAISFGPGTWNAANPNATDVNADTVIDGADYIALFGGLPVFEIYEDVPPTSDLDIGAATTTLVEEEFDFDGDGGGVGGATVPPPTASPSQFENGADGFPLPNNVSTATDGTLFAAGWLDTVSVTYTFFDSSVVGSSVGAGPNGGTVFKVDFTAKGVVTDGSIAGKLIPIEAGGAWDGSDINITWAGTLFGEAFDQSIGAAYGFDPFAAWNLRTSLAGNSGDASFTIIPIPEPTTMALLGFALVPLAFRRRKKSA